MAIAPGRYSFMGGAVLGKGNGAQLVLERSSSILTVFSNDEYDLCKAAVAEGKAVCVQWKNGGATQQAQLTAISNTGEMVFVLNELHRNLYFTVSGSEPHTVGVRTSDYDCDQLVIVHTDMNTPFTNGEYQDCIDAVDNGKAVCVEFTTGGTSVQAQLTQKTHLGELIFEFTTGPYHYTYSVDPTTSAHSITETVIDLASGFIPKGEASVATLNALSSQENGWVYTLTDAGTLTDGSLAVVAGDTVAWDDGNSVWYKALNYAPMQYGTNEVHNLASASGADFVAGKYLAMDCPEGPKKLPAEILSTLNHLRVETNDDFLYAILDSHERFLFGIRHDGSVDWEKGIPEHIQNILNNIVSELSNKVNKEAGKSLINSIFAEGLTVTTTDDYLLLVTDSENRIVFSIDKSGKVEQFHELEEVVQKKITGKTVINEIFANGISITSDEFHLFVIQDSAGRVVLSVDSSGKVEQIEELRGVFQEKEAGKSVINKQFSDGVSITYDDNNLVVVTDRDGRVLFNITNDGTIPQIVELVKDKVDKEAGYSLVPKFIKDLFTISSDENHLLVLTDTAGRLILDITKDGRLEVTKDIPSVVDALSKKVNKEHGKGLIDNRFEAGLSYPVGSYLHLIVDAIGRFITGIRGDGSIDFGTKVNFLQGVNWSSENLTDLQKALSENGINLSARNQSDWSDAKSVHIQPPKLSIVNIEMTSALPQYKGDKKTGHIEFWDLNGNYFKKKIKIDVQGNSTQWFPKKNFAIDLLNEDDTEFGLKFGDWPEQDSYHIKAWWVDMFRGLGQVYYELLDEVWAYNRGPLNRPWMQAIVSSERLTNRGYGCEYNYQPDSLDSRIDSGAKCHPLGFPVLVYYNGDFYGVSSFAMKKHRKNYHMNKKTYNEIIIDGVLRAEEFWSGENSIDWTSFELRNPKTLITMSGDTYDGDNPQELIDNTSPAWTASKDQKNTQKTKNYIKAFSNVMPQIEAAVIQYGVDSQEVIDLYDQYFNVDNLIDYILFSDVILDTDTGANNVLWTTWDGVKWYACPYDLDRSCGMWQGFLTGNAASALLSRQGLPTYYIGQNATFRSRLEARYHELRDGGVFTQDHLWSFAKRWSDSIGVDNYTEEFKRWPQNIVNSNAEINTDYWDIVLVDELPVMSATGDWSDSTAYNIGDFAFYGPGDVNGLGTASGYYKFVCTSPNTNQPPIKTLKCKDSLWRLYAWFGYQLRAMDLFYNYPNS